MRVISGGGFFLARLIAGEGLEHAEVEIRLAPLAHIDDLRAPPALLTPAIQGGKSAERRVEAEQWA